MTHQQAFALVSEICPAQAGLLWNTSDHEGCDTTTAVADQYGDDLVEMDDARRDLGLIAAGIKPTEWEAYSSDTIRHLEESAS